jgi:hypothetical protein
LVRCIDRGGLRLQFEEEEKNFPIVGDFLKLSEDDVAYHLFATQFLKRIVGEERWRENHYRKLLSEYSTPGDEAFGLLTLENNYDRWSAMAISGDHANKLGNAPTALYTNSGNSKGENGAPRKFHGWSAAGYKRFNELHALVRKDRLTPTRRLFEYALLEELQVLHARKRHQKKNLVDEDDPDGYPAHDFEDVDEGGMPSENDSDNRSSEGDDDMESHVNDDNADLDN